MCCDYLCKIPQTIKFSHTLEGVMFEGGHLLGLEDLQITILAREVGILYFRYLVQDFFSITLGAFVSLRRMLKWSFIPGERCAYLDSMTDMSQRD